MPPFYIIDPEALSSSGPFDDRDAVLEDVSVRPEEDRDGLLLFTLNEEGSEVADLHDWMEAPVTD